MSSADDIQEQTSNSQKFVTFKFPDYKNLVTNEPVTQYISVCINKVFYRKTVFEIQKIHHLTKWRLKDVSFYTRSPN